MSLADTRQANTRQVLPPQRAIRSFVRREGRLTPGQRRALQQYWSRYGLKLTAQAVDLNRIFGRQAPCIVEIGFGMGDALLGLASEYPANNYLGIEVYQPGVGSLLRRLAARHQEHVRVISEDAAVVLRQMIRDQALDAVYLFFPDPWPKKRHHKRRLVQPEFVELLARKLRPGGVFHMATDWHDYARHMLQVTTDHNGFCNLAGEGRFAPRPAYRPLTKFEQRGRRLGHDVYDLVLLRRDDAAA